MSDLRENDTDFGNSHFHTIPVLVDLRHVNIVIRVIHGLRIATLVLA